MTRVLRVLGDAVLWLLVGLGVASALVWGATRLGYVKPLVVVSGSMEPGIMTGDLVVDRPHPTAGLAVGAVASIRSDRTGQIVTHRVVAVDRQPDGSYRVRLKGDANRAVDGEDYVVGTTVWQPALRVPRVGTAVATLARRSVAVPLGVSLLAVVGIVALPGGRRRAPAHAAGAPAGVAASAAVSVAVAVPPAVVPPAVVVASPAPVVGAQVRPAVQVQPAR